jgi:aldehyde dehydrogenase (NAD+)
MAGETMNGPAGLSPFTGEIRMLIDGELVEAASGLRFSNVNPATEAVLGEVADAGTEDMSRAIGAARRAFDDTDWASNARLRQRCLRQLQEAFEAEREELRAELVAEAGIPVRLTYGYQLDLPLRDCFEWPARMIDEFSWGRRLPDSHSSLSSGPGAGPSSRRLVWKEPMGVVGSIIPGNAPVEITVNKLAQVLATGNTTVIKPAPDTPWNATRLGRMIAERTDVPPGVVSIVTSADHQVGEHLTLDPRVDAISFTGSTATGQRIMVNGAASFKRLFLELGGKSAMVVLDDVDDLHSVLANAATVCSHSGQGCGLQTRILVPLSRYKEAVKILEQVFSNIPYGDPADAAVIQGPQISELQRTRVLGHIHQAVAQGARLLIGGGIPVRFPKGYYVEPTLFADVENSMDLAQEEVFGPVAAVIPFEDDAHALKIANDSKYGLGGGIFSVSEERALQFARGLRTGTISINGGVRYGADAPFGGYKHSGIGRQNGLEGFEQYLETKTVAIGGEIGGSPPDQGADSGRAGERSP